MLASIPVWQRPQPSNGGKNRMLTRVYGSDAGTGSGNAGQRAFKGTEEEATRDRMRVAINVGASQC